MKTGTTIMMTTAVSAMMWLTVPVRADDAKPGDTIVNVTGCLAQGNERNELSIKDAEGKTYGLKVGSELNLRAHVGQKVTITGNPVKTKEKVKAGQTEESEHLRVSNYTIVTSTCP